MPEKKKKSRQAGANVKTSARLALLQYILGLLILVLGAGWLLCITVTVDSTVLSFLRNVLQGISGQLYWVTPFMTLWLGAMLVTSAYHGVSVRNYALTFCLFLAVLSTMTLVTFVSGKGNLMEYIYAINQQKLVGAPSSMAAYMQRVFLWGSEGKMQLCGGGAMSMLFAFPAYRLFGAIGGIIFLIILLIALFLLLTRIDVITLFRGMSDAMERRRVSKMQKRQAAQATAPEQQNRQPQTPEPVQSIPMQPLRNGQKVQVETSCDPEWPQYQQPMDASGYSYEQTYAPYDQQGYEQEPNYQPAYYQQPAEQYASAPMTQDGFYPVNNANALYDERFVLHPPTDDFLDSQPDKQDIQERESFEPINEPNQPAATQKPMPPETVKEPVAAALERPVKKETTPSEKAPVYHPSPLVRPQDDVPPWEETGLDEPSEQPVPAQVKEKDAKKSDAPLSAWQVMLQKKKEEMENGQPAPYSQDIAKPLTERGPKQVFTDAAVPLTGERVQISESTPPADHSNARMDGTPQMPRIRQSNLPVSFAYTAPPMRFLGEGQSWQNRPDSSNEDTQRAQLIERTLATFNISAGVREITHGPAITRFALRIAEGIKVKQVVGVLDNIALEMGSDRVRVEAPIPGTSYIGIEVPNSKVSPVMLREVLDSEEMRKNPSPLVVALGKDIAGKPILCDLSKMPHLLIAGATGSGKSVCINSIVCSLLYRASPAQVRLIMVDPKQVELQVYNGIPQLLVPVVSDPKKAAAALNWVVTEMFERYSKFSAKSVRNLEGYNRKMEGTEDVLPHIVVIIDEMADLMDACRKDVEESVRRLAALARAAGIYMVLATQRPSVDVITGVIKNNIPSRIAFTVSSGVDSRTIIDINGAEKLMGKGDMLYQPTGVSKPTRVQGCFVSDDEVTAITDFIRSRYQSEYDPNVLEHMDKPEASADDPMDDDGGVEAQDEALDDLLKEAIRMAVEDGQSSISMLQRRLRVGYARAGRLIDEMTKRGIISESEGSKPRKTLITREEYLQLTGSQ